MSPLAEARNYHRPNQFISSDVVTEARQWAEEITPATEPCMGEECRFREEGEETCTLTVHHTIFPKIEVGRTKRRALIASRRSPASKIMMYQCRHAQRHAEQPPSPFPEDDVVRAYNIEARVIEDLGITVMRLSELEFETSAEGTGLSDDEVANYLSDRHFLISRRSELVRRMAELQIIKPAVVKGALLKLAPGEMSGRPINDEIALPSLSAKELKSLRIRRAKEARLRAA